MSKEAVDLTGMTFDELEVVARAENSAAGRTRWICKCSCGNTCIVQGNNLMSKATKNCGKCQKAASEFSSISLFRLQQGAVSEDAEIDPYRHLASAIVAVAADDYRTALKKKDIKQKDSLEKFFKSGWYKLLTNLDPKFLVERLESEHQAKLSAALA